MSLITVIKKGKWYSECNGQEGLPSHKWKRFGLKEKCPLCQKARDERKAKSLKRSALASAKFRGHNMKKFVKTARERGEYVSTCKNCDKGILIVVNPLPNETEIMGGAVALNCPKGA
ncbi:MAG: hypothetical protein WC976_06330 [Caldisericia bacterium]